MFSPSLSSSASYSVRAFISDLRSAIRPYRGTFLLGVFLRITSDIADLYPAWALSRIVVLLTSESYSSDLLVRQLLLLMGGWFIVVGYYSVAHGAAKWFGYQVAERVALDVRLKALKHIFSLDIAWQEKENTGNKIKRIDHGSRSLDTVIRIVFDVIIEASLNTIGMLLIFSSLSWNLGIAMLCFMLYYFIVSSRLTTKASKQATVVNGLEEDLEGLSYESLNNIKTVKSLSIQKTLAERLGKLTENTYKAIRKRIWLFRLRSSILHLSYLLFEACMIVYILYEILQGNLSAAVLILFVGYFSKVEEAISELAEVTHELVICKVQFSRLKSILDTKPTIEGDLITAQQVAMPANWQTIELRNVSFSYENKAILNSFNLSIRRGEKIGIVGLSGAGKSTLFSLLMDLYENYEGSILIDTVPLHRIDRHDYVNHIAVVLQETELFNSTLAENIIIGSQPGSLLNEERLAGVIKNAHLTDVLARLPEGAQTVIGEKGVKLSGGEKQRLGIARALYRQPDLLLLDEATSHLDVESERRIQDSLHEFFRQVTAVVIAHRLSTIKAMDRILVMQGGKIAESGSFSELLQAKGIFARLWEQQKL